MKIIISERQQKLIKENDLKDSLIDMIKDGDWKSTADLVGGDKNLKKLLGFNDPEKFVAEFSSNDEYIHSLSEIQQLNLSITEHLRWNSFHYIHGWSVIPPEKIPGKTKSEKLKPQNV